MPTYGGDVRGRDQYYNVASHGWAEADGIAESVKGMQEATDKLTEAAEQVVATGKPMSQAQIQIGTHTEQHEIGSYPSSSRPDGSRKKSARPRRWRRRGAAARHGRVVGPLLDSVARYAHQFYTLGSQVNEQGLTATTTHYVDSVSGARERYTSYGKPEQCRRTPSSQTARTSPGPATKIRLRPAGAR